MKKNLKITIIGIVGVAILVSAGLIIKSKSNNIPIVDAANDSVLVKAEPAAKGTITDKVFTIGEIEPMKSFEVNPMTAGTVKKVYVEVGDTVKKDQVLYELEMDEFNIEMNSQKTQLTNGLNVSKNAYELAKKTYEDMQKLHIEKAVSDYDLENSKLKYESAQQDYKNVQNNYNTLLASISEKEDYYIIKSPEDGIVTSKTVEEGMSVTQQNGMTVIADDTLKVSSSVTSKHINKIEEGQEVLINVSTAEVSLKGTVSSISYSAQNGSYPIEIDIEDSNQGIKPGMYAELYINTNSRENTLLISEKAIITRDNEQYIYTINDNQAKKVIIKKGIEDGEMVEISGDIKAGDMVITTGKDKITDGAFIKLAE